MSVPLGVVPGNIKWSEGNVLCLSTTSYCHQLTFELVHRRPHVYIMVFTIEMSPYVIVLEYHNR